jgi:rubrerythrin
MKRELNELLQQMLEAEIGGIQVYTTALECVLNEDLKEEWTEYLEQTQQHERVVRKLLDKLGLQEMETPGRQVVRHTGKSLVLAMAMAQANDTPEAAELVACECVVHAETKDHLNWTLLSKFAEVAAKGEAAAILEACEEVEDQEDEHLYHSKGWCRELWLSSLGMEAVLPPPEEQKNVKTALDAAQAEKSREKLL